MNIYEVVDARTSDTEAITHVHELIGKRNAYAYFLNYNSHGYAKFKVDPRSLIAYEEKLSVIYI